VLLVVYTDASEIGGAEISLGNLLAALGTDVDVTVLATDARVGAAVAARRPGTALELVPPVRDKLDLRPILAHLKAMRRLRPDVFHANLRTPYSCQYGLLAAIVTRGVRVVAVEHLPLASDSGVRRRLKRLTSSRLAAHVAVGDATARFVEQDAGLPPGSIQTIRNGVPAPRARAGVGSGSGSGSGSPTIGSVGRLDSQKGFDVLVAALAQLPEVHCVLIGDGPERDAILAAAQRHGVGDRLTLTGRLDDPADRVAELDVFVLPSRFEGFPLVVLEAMLAGVPVVATDVGAVREAVDDGATGLLVGPEDAAGLARAIRRMLDEPGLRARVAEAALARARMEFTADVMASRFVELYRRVGGRDS
jgi:glycosyltransferase involved in cell wall biosynthesis